MKKTLFTLLAAVTLTAAVAPASAQFYDPYESPRRVYRERYYEPPAPRYYRPEPREVAGYGRGCNAVKGTFCWVSRPRPLGASCSCPKDGGTREGYIDR
jgi:hypothetical protein